jgi:hypothetical protein
MLYRKIISLTSSLLQLIFGLCILVLWTIAYPLLRMRYSYKRRYTRHPSFILFKGFIWTNSLFKFDYFKK